MPSVRTIASGAAAMLTLALPLAFGSRVAWATDQPPAVTPPNLATVQELPQVVVIGNAPLPGFGLPLNQIPANVQTASSADIESQQSTDVAEYLSNSFSGVN